MTQIVRGEGNAVALELERNLLTDELQGGLVEVGINARQIDLSQIESFYLMVRG